jgi:pimeloyl-ACP methyl ester carboxylesterase
LRGYGGSSSPANEADYNLYHVGTDVVNLIELLGEKTVWIHLTIYDTSTNDIDLLFVLLVSLSSSHSQAVLVGHDWGAVLSWQIGIVFAKYFSAIICLSCPRAGWPSYKPTNLFTKLFGVKIFFGKTEI